LEACATRFGKGKEGENEEEGKGKGKELKEGRDSHIDPGPNTACPCQRIRPTASHSLGDPPVPLAPPEIFVCDGCQGGPMHMGLPKKPKPGR
jgi:hypothetical protein